MPQMPLRQTSTVRIWHATHRRPALRTPLKTQTAYSGRTGICVGAPPARHPAAGRGVRLLLEVRVRLAHRTPFSPAEWRKITRSGGELPSTPVRSLSAVTREAV